MTTRIDLTKEEIELILQSLVLNKITLEEDIEHYEKHNTTGINDKKLPCQKSALQIAITFLLNFTKHRKIVNTNNTPSRGG